MTTIERIMFRHGITVEAGEQAQRDSIADAFGKLAVIPILDAH